MTMKIELAPAFNAHYYSYYVFGLMKTFGKSAISYSSSNWPTIHQHALVFRASNQNVEKKIYISAGDGTGLSSEGLAWCDVYAKVNVDPEMANEPHAEKLFPIGPSFGVHYLSLGETLSASIRSFLIFRKSIAQPREHFANYFRQWRYRLPFDAYQPAPSQSDYLFFLATIWRKEQYVNQLRATFIQVGSSLPGVKFEGGFAPGKEDSLPGDFSNLVAARKYPLSEYIANLQRSVVAFNTPAAQHCLGWKLAEFLALGKAIISTPLTRSMPAPLVHGKHVHYVKDTPNDIRDALQEISQNHAYRRQLELGAREYFMKYLHPQRVLERIFERVGIS